MSEKKSGKKRGKPATTAGKIPQGPMDVDLLQRLVDLMTRNDLNTVELRDGQKRVTLKRGADTQAIPQISIASPAHAPSSSAAPAAPGNHAAPADDTAGLVPIKSPMIGTFYAKPSPDAKPFVTVGSEIDEDTDVCVIEAMKVFNNIKAETSGTIAKILVDDGETVEFGTVLFLVKP